MSVKLRRKEKHTQKIDVTLEKHYIYSLIDLTGLNTALTRDSSVRQRLVEKSDFKWMCADISSDTKPRCCGLDFL